MSSKRFHCKSGGKLPIFHLRRILGPSRDSCGGVFASNLALVVRAKASTYSKNGCKSFRTSSWMC